MANSLLKSFWSKINMAIMLLVLLLLIGMIGFRILTGESWIDCFYMTVITISTVGFTEAVPIDENAKIFTILLILTGFIVVGYAIKVITEYIILRNDAEEIKLKKMQKKIDGMQGHIVICGYGRNGAQVARKLAAYDKDFVVIERNKELVEKMEDSNIPYVLGNANEDETLEQAGIDRASCLISALPSDADNVFVVLSARQKNKNIRIISRASHESTYSKLKLAGANNVILPDKIGGDHMASLVVIPDLIEFIDNLAIVGKTNINIEQVDVEKLYDTTEVKSIRDLDLRKKTGCNVIGYKDPKGDYIVNPEADQELAPNSTIIVLGRPEQIQKLNTLFNI
ncbi:MAG: potassium channel protein [Bacteroidia bacterium]|nr:potassium channel protein [Bacteroidia bacterium]MBT8269801.1 potassium channel protein [Bacteroidia bacterium]NNF82662.1 potassium channel protein [Flavobacteriaceae bacterium]NNK70866.1 potassium channel protein [Flavobacteriaceae bacterium]NNL80404.1 potassium channel protein [Flavobacteriaceae bacterium]